MCEIAFQQMLTTCNKDIPSYDVNTLLQGIVVDWSVLCIGHGHITEWLLDYQQLWQTAGY